MRDIDTGEAVRSYKEGELCIQGPQVMKGYNGNPLATSQIIDREGWLHTGVCDGPFLFNGKLICNINQNIRTVNV